MSRFEDMRTSNKRTKTQSCTQTREMHAKSQAINGEKLPVDS
jgi:hypothetical protein